MLAAAWLLCTCYAATDEFHQIFVPGRTPKVTDVMIDSAGAALGIGMMFLLSRRPLVATRILRYNPTRFLNTSLRKRTTVRP